MTDDRRGPPVERPPVYVKGDIKRALRYIADNMQDDQVDDEGRVVIPINFDSVLNDSVKELQLATDMKCMMDMLEKLVPAFVGIVMRKNNLRPSENLHSLHDFPKPPSEDVT